MSSNQFGKPPGPPPPPAPKPTHGTKLPPPSKETEKLQSLEDMVRSMNEKIQHAEVLNGGFNELKEKVTEIHTEQVKVAMEIKSIRAAELISREKISDITDAIYDPDNGIYRRINEGMVMDKQRDEKLAEALVNIQKVQEAVTPIEKTDEELKKIAGDDLKELHAIVKTRQIIDRMFWIMLTALLGGAGKLLWDFISTYNN